MRSTSPSMLFRCRSRPGRKSPEPRPRLVVMTHAFPSASTTDMFVVCVSAPRVSRRGSTARTRSVSLMPRSTGNAGISSGSPARPPRVSSVVPAYSTSSGSLQRASYAARSSAVTAPPRPRINERIDCASDPVYADARLRQRAAPAPSRFRAAEAVRRLEQRVARRVDARARVHRHHGREHREARGLGGVIGTPTRASLSAGPKRSRHGSRP